MARCRNVKHPEYKIKVDITRQKEHFVWVYVTSTSGATQTESSSFLFGDTPNDDSTNVLNNGTRLPQKDEDVDFYKDRNGIISDSIFSRDMPGDEYAMSHSRNRLIQRMNMLEFVRIRFDGVAFLNDNGRVEGSRSSGKYVWHSRLDIVNSVVGLVDAVWIRNLAAPITDNDIGVNLRTLGIAP